MTRPPGEALWAAAPLTEVMPEPASALTEKNPSLTQLYAYWLVQIYLERLQ
ncbi:MAG: hypothetical protein HY940_01325 [Gammaproteobacteria bacterium]|nr:hypothetical protein [Gammaproteobacteria bacterium]